MADEDTKKKKKKKLDEVIAPPKNPLTEALAGRGESRADVPPPGGDPGRVQEAPKPPQTFRNKQGDVIGIIDPNTGEALGFGKTTLSESDIRGAINKFAPDTPQG